MFDKNESISIDKINNSNVKQIGHSYNKVDWFKISVVVLLFIITLFLLYEAGVINEKTVQEIIMKLISKI